MKKNTALTLLILLIIQTMAQKASVLDDKLKWNIGTHCVNESPINPYDKWTTSFLHTEGDTLMFGKHFKKLTSCTDSLCRKNNINAYIREEANKVFLANKTEELLQFNFNLKKGDTMVMDFLQDVMRHIRLYIRVDSVKPITFQDQKDRIAQYVTVFDYYNSNLSSRSINDVFVEGIGSLKFGLEYPQMLFATGDHVCRPNLLCCYSGEFLIYSDAKIKSCYLYTWVQQLLQPSRLVQVITPNPGLLEIQLTEAKAGNLYIFDLNGKQIFRHAVNRSGIQFCLPSLGVYLYRFESEQGEVQNGKVLVN